MQEALIISRIGDDQIRGPSGEHDSPQSRYASGKMAWIIFLYLASGIYNRSIGRKYIPEQKKISKHVCESYVTELVVL
jgi:hypothetical protein